MIQKQDTRWARYAAVALMAAVPRVVFLFTVKPAFSGYQWVLSNGLLQHGALEEDGVRTAMYDPLYPLFLSGARLLVGDSPVRVQLLQILVASIGAAFLYALLETLTGRRRTAFLGAALFAGYPMLIDHAVIPGDSALLSTLLLVFACAFVNMDRARDAALAGIGLGLAILTRAAVAPLAILATVALVADRKRWPAAVLVVTVCAPLLVRNYQLNGALWPTRSGVNLLIGNSPYTDAVLPEYSTDLIAAYAWSVVEREQPALLAPAAESGRDRFYTALAWREMKAHPMHTLRLTFLKAAYFFWPRLVPSRNMSASAPVVFDPAEGVRTKDSPRQPWYEEVAYTVPYLFVVAGALVGIWTRRAEIHRDAILWCIVATFVAVYAVYFPATYYRGAMEFVLLFYAAIGIDHATCRATW